MYRLDLKPANPIDFEGIWQRAETAFPSVVAAIEAGTIHSEPELLDALRDCLAVHFARSNTIERVARAARDPVIASVTEHISRRPDLRSPAGLIPAGQEGRKVIADQWMDRQVTTRFRHEEIVPERMMAVYHTIRDFVFSQAVEIGVATGGEFLIGDTPALTFRSGRGFQVPLGEAEALFMPIGRKHVATLASANRYVPLPRDQVDGLNRAQAAAAHMHVMWHPNAEMDGFVQGVREGIALPPDSRTA